MAVKPLSSVELLDFPGVMDVDPRDLTPGAAEEQTNACSIIQGELTVRRGYREVTFENS